MGRHTLTTLPTSFLIFLLACIHPAYGQTPSSTTGPLRPTSSTSRTWITQTTTYTHLTNLPTLSFPSATTTSDPTIPGLPPTTGSYGRPSTNPQDTQRDSLVNLYFVFLLLLVLAAGFLAWLYFRRRKLRLLALRTSRRDALERDLSGSGNSEGFFGLFSGGGGGATGRRRWLPVFGRGVDGLDERGEAPPPYTTKAREESGEVRLGVLETRGKPPDYEERDVGSSDGSPTVGGSTLRGSGEVERSGSGRSVGSTVAEGRGTSSG
ncbi:hypothetical protein C1H76_8660 [Elsinoe australis]|uniref:Uncharacterized protein n=1 Tax=Elsinoe australis TaxID=40998 RepID=A0A4U7ARR9_9PEZI|nr:hypothetical protein C1H76_8660 [Elsinoe australis]